MASIQQFEGTWEEIMSRASQLAGKRLRVTVLPAEPDQVELRRRARKLMAEVDVLEPDPNRPKLQGLAGEFADGVAEKLRREGERAKKQSAIRDLVSFHSDVCRRGI